MEGQFNSRISRLERMKDSETEIPKPTSADAGKVVTVNQDGDGYELTEGGGGGGADIYIGIPVTMADAPPLPEGYTMSQAYTGLTDNDVCPIYVDNQNQTPDIIDCVYPYMGKLSPVYIRDPRLSALFHNAINVAFKFENIPSVVDDPNAEKAILTVKSSSKLYSVLDTASNVTYYCIDKSDLEWVRSGSR